MSEQAVRADVRAFLDRMQATPRPPFTAEVLAKIRLMPPEMMAAMDRPVGDLAVIRDLSIAGPGGEIALRLFDARADREAGPVVVFYHGGGFVVGGIASHAGLAAEIARQLDLPVLSVEYRLAPENPWPAGADDAEAAARWIADNGAALGREITGLILCGDSAGGNLTLVTAQALRDTPAAVPVRLQCALYPGTDHSRKHPSRVTFAKGVGLDGTDMDLYDLHYASDGTHWRSSPLLGDHRGLPPLLLVTASHDPLRDEGRAYAAAAIAAGVPTTYREVEGTIHGFATYRAALPSAQADLTAVLTLAKAMIAEG
ncbi:alpha/beta hydrolase [Sphingobium sufflavum]|uniref:alpha/beta hydrolase n=1 Tax=Sphingobium sufflavum TaxID=1129547 RepID=UPI001F17F749|nr:alpha/beta hydrolase [Sphingobium sufflavum]MCE7795184.1 alpha/beta hydrolase [Sphingobium sufflavum]